LEQLSAGVQNQEPRRLEIELENWVKAAVKVIEEEITRKLYSDLK
jgi:hypothetical protein